MSISATKLASAAAAQAIEAAATAKYYANQTGAQYDVILSEIADFDSTYQEAITYCASAASVAQYLYDNAAGAIASIADASGIAVDSSGVAYHALDVANDALQSAGDANSLIVDVSGLALDAKQTAIDASAVTLVDLASNNGSSLVGFIQDASGSILRDVEDKLYESKSVKDFGAIGYGGADDTAAIAKAISWANGGSRRLHFPYGVYITNEAIKITADAVFLTGDGRFCTKILYTGSDSTVDIVSFQGASSSSLLYMGGIFGLWIDSGTTMTAGRGLLFKYASRISCSGICVGEQSDAAKSLYHGLEYYSTDFQLFRDFEIVAKQDGLRVSGGGAGNPGPQYDLWVWGGKIAGCTVGLHVGGGWDNAYFDKCMITSNGTNVLVDNSIQSFKNQEVNFGAQFVTDQAQTGPNYLINDTLANTTNYGQIVISGPVTGAKSSNGIQVKNWPGCFVNVFSPYIAGNSGQGIEIDDASAKVCVSSATNITGNGGYAIYSGSSVSVCATCYMLGNTQGTMSSLVSNDLYQGKKSGSGVIAIGSSSVVISHGLSRAPLGVNISITSTTGTPVFLDTSSITSSSFTVRSASSVTGTAAGFVWQATD